MFTGFKVPPPSCAMGGVCLRRFGDLRKNTPLDFWSMYLVDFVEKWTSFTEKCVKFTKLYSKNIFLEFASGARRARQARRAPGSGVSKCCSDLPSTRAGGQDDGS